MVLEQKIIVLENDKKLGLKDFETYFVSFNTRTGSIKLHNKHFNRLFQDVESFNHFINKVSFICPSEHIIDKN